MADLSTFGTKVKSDEGVIFPVKLDGQKLPLALLIYGSDSDVVKNYERNRIRKIGIGKNGKTDIDQETLDELIDSQDEGIIIRIGGIYTYDWKKEDVTEEPVMWGDKELKNDRKSYSILITQIPALKDFIAEKSNERSNFLA